MRGAHPSSWRAEALETLRLSVPLAAANMLQMAVYAIDVIFVARLGQTALAASALSVNLFGLMAWSAFSLVGAVATLIAAEQGRARAVREVRRSARMALWLSAGLGLAIMAVCMGARASCSPPGSRPMWRGWRAAFWAC
jgi:MATE family multidrug resistance protein